MCFAEIAKMESAAGSKMGWNLLQGFELIGTTAPILFVVRG
jgi:hypothetical protein